MCGGARLDETAPAHRKSFCGDARASGQPSDVQKWKLAPQHDKPMALPDS
jgi:hypothetical protein